MVQYWDTLKQKLIVDILGLVVCEDATANGLTSAVVSLLTKFSIPLERVIGFSADTCNVMFGKNHSVSILLKELMPNVLTVPCSSHSAHLCASYASKRLPKEMEDVLRGIYCHFSRSSARKREFAKFQEFVQAADHNILSPGQTRWLSQEACVNRILEQREALILYFQAESVDDPTAANTLIHTMLSNEMTVPFLEFLSYALNCFNEFNTLFQSASPKLHLLEERVSTLIKDFAQNFMHFRYVVGCTCKTIDPYLSTQYVPLDKVYLGMAAMESIKKLSEENQQFVIKHCRSFYIQAVLEIQKRYDLDDAFFEIVKLVHPVNARKRNPESLIKLFRQYPHLEKKVDASHADREWRSHSHLDVSLLQCTSEDEVRILDTETYWNRVLSLKFDGQPRFPNLSICISFLFSMPFSNVLAEREFSAFKLIKTDHRNPLHNLTVSSILRIKHWGTNENHSASTVVIPKSLIDNVKSIKASSSIADGSKTL